MASRSPGPRSSATLLQLQRENQRLTEQVRRGQREWTRTFDAIGEAIALCDRDGRVHRANRALCHLSGLERPAVEGRLLDEVLAPLSLVEQVRAALAAGQAVLREQSPPEQGRTYSISISPITPLVDDGGNEAADGPDQGPAAVLVLRDVTDEKRLQRRLLLGERMAAVGQLAAGLAHEINNPVSFAYSNIQVARELIGRHPALSGAGLPELPELRELPELHELPEMLDECLHGLGRVRDIVRDLRTFTSAEVRVPSGEVRLDDLVDLALRLTHSEVQERARLRYDRELSPTPPIRGDAGKLSNLVMNLVQHALHNLVPPSEPVSGEQCITVRTRVDRRSGCVELSVADTGPVLSDEMRAHLFDPFAQRRTRPGPGLSAALGLGLAVSYEVVHHHGGEIEARPGAGGGNELIVRLPLPG